MGPHDWDAMTRCLCQYRTAIVRSLAHCHRSTTDSWEGIAASPSQLSS